jgi:hypothetical protein
MGKWLPGDGRGLERKEVQEMSDTFYWALMLVLFLMIVRGP